MKMYATEDSFCANLIVLGISIDNPAERDAFGIPMG